MTHQALYDIWQADRAAIGGWVTAGHEFALQTYRRAGYDYVGVDCQHSVLNEAEVATMLLRTSANDPPTIVRVSKNDPALIGRLADAGADGVIVPMVSSPDEAADAVRAVRYPPQGGIRSFGPIRPGLPAVDLDAMAERVDVFVMIETAAGLDCVEAIAAVQGVTGIYIGPADLAIGLGMDPMPAFTTDQLVEPIDRINRACRTSGIVLGMHQLGGASAGKWIGRGVRMATLGSDASMFAAAAKAELELAQQHHRLRPASSSSGTPYVS
jgi:4-hydroxy-2-oxoheptanedioate aldolase